MTMNLLFAGKNIRIFLVDNDDKMFGKKYERTNNWNTTDVFLSVTSFQKKMFFSFIERIK